VLRRSRTLPAGLLCGLVAVAALSGCATFDRNDVAASVGDAEVSIDDIAALQTGEEAVPGDAVRQQLTLWIRTARLQQYSNVPVDATLGSADEVAINQLVAALVDPAEAEGRYDAGDSSLVCPRAIPVATPEDGTGAIEAYEAGTSFADVAAQYSNDPQLAASGGELDAIIGGECVAPDGLNPDLIALLTDIPVGSMALRELSGGLLILQRKPFAELSAGSQQQIAASLVTEDDFAAVFDDAVISVDPRYGRWDAATFTVVPMQS
jgi:hypothetical protein